MLVRRRLLVLVFWVTATTAIPLKQPALIFIARTAPHANLVIDGLHHHHVRLLSHSFRLLFLPRHIVLLQLSHVLVLPKLVFDEFLDDLLLIIQLLLRLHDLHSFIVFILASLLLSTHSLCYALFLFLS